MSPIPILTVLDVDIINIFLRRLNWVFTCVFMSRIFNQRQRQRHITLVERLKSHTATSEALVMSQAKLA